MSEIEKRLERLERRDRWLSIAQGASLARTAVGWLAFGSAGDLSIL